MEPTIGRIVHYIHGGDETNNPHNHYAAVVTHVWSPECVNLFVFAKGSALDNESGVRTSVLKGDTAGRWHWPEREGATRIEPPTFVTEEGVDFGQGGASRHVLDEAQSLDRLAGTGD